MGFVEQLNIGLAGEGVISKCLRDRGWNVLPAYEVPENNGKGPVLRTAKFGSIIVPDMLIFNGTEIRWIEAKTKSSFTWYRIGEQWQDGIDKRHWFDYCKVADISKFPVWLMFLHRENQPVAKDTPIGLKPPTGLFGQEIEILKDRIDHTSDNHGTSGMVYWNKSVFMNFSKMLITDAIQGRDAQEVIG